MLKYDPWDGRWCRYHVASAIQSGIYGPRQRPVTVCDDPACQEEEIGDIMRKILCCSIATMTADYFAIVVQRRFDSCNVYRTAFNVK